VSAGFTPGPLIVRVMPDKEIYIFEGPEGDMGQSVLEGGFVLHDDDENLANALLWAAAPELDEAAELALEALDDPVVGTPDQDDPDWYRKVDIAVAALKAALARARGDR
jgi:hypothetical protein